LVSLAPDITSVLLASASPQRHAILTQMRIPFRVIASDVDELSVGNPDFVAVENSRLKAAAVVDQARQNEMIVGVDTLVTLDGAIYGKPTDRDDAERMLRLLRGQTHTVVGGLTAIAGGESRQLCARTRVTFRTFSDPFLTAYLDSEEWRGRAGGYAIQGSGAGLVAAIGGDYLNVVGFPLEQFLNEFGDELALQRSV
jgi:septum formation protein